MNGRENSGRSGSSCAKGAGSPFDTRHLFSEPTPAETEVMRRLVDADFPGRDERAKQLASCRVQIIDDDGQSGI